MSLYSAILAIVSLVNLFIAIFVFTRNVKNETNNVFCYFGLSLAVWGLGAFVQSLASTKPFALACLKFIHLGQVFIPSTFYHFTLAITGDDRKFNRGLSLAAYIFSLVFLGLDRFGLMARDVTCVYGFYYPVAGPADKYFNTFFLLLVSYGIFLLYQRHRRTGSTLEKNRLKYLFIGIIIALLGSIANILLVLGIRVYPLAALGVLGYNLCVAYAIVRYHLMDVNLIIRRGLVYSLLTGAMSGIFFFSLVMFERMLFTVPASGRTLLSGVTTALVIAIVFQPLREILQVRIDRAFLREGYNKRLVLETLRKRIADFIDRRELLSITLGTLMEVFPIERVIILLHRGDEGGYGVSLSAGLDHLKRRNILFGEDTVLIRFLRETKHGILRAEAEENPEIDSGLVRDFDTLEVELCIPIVYGEELLGILALGRKSFNRLYSIEEIDILTRLGEKIGLGVENTRLVEETRRRFIATILSLLKAIGTRDAYTWKHCENVSEYAARVADRLGLSHELVEAIKIGGLLHDIGKIGIDDHILLKPDKLNEEEFDIIKRHPSIGSVILKPIGLHPMAHNGVLHHHESIDGNGYPDGLKGEEFTLAAKILAVVDNYDAMTTDRPYRPAMKKEEAIKELKKGRRQRFDENVIRTFFRILEEEEG